MKNKKLKTYSLDEVKDKFVGKKGDEKRDKYEFELNLELLGEMIKKIRKEKNMSQDELGKLVGVQKAQISKLENNTRDIRLLTVLKVFSALNAKINFKVEIEKQELQLLAG